MPWSDFLVLHDVEFLPNGMRSSAFGQADSSEAHHQEEIIFHCPLNAATPASVASSPWRVPGCEAEISPAHEGAAVRSGLRKQSPAPHRAQDFTPSLER